VNPTPNDKLPDRPRPPPPDLLQQGLVRLLRPLVRLAIISGVTFPMLADLLRSLYVDVASRDLLPDERARTDSRISLLTGVHRKELRRQRTPADTPEPPALTLSSQVIARWLGSAELTGPDGTPLPLPRLGPAPSFEALVSSVTRDIRPRALLDSWLDQGIATLDAAGLVRLENAAYIPQADRQTQVFYFARNLHDHAAAAAANVTSAGSPLYLERAVHYDGLSREAAAKLEAIAREAATTALLEVNRRAMAIAEEDDAAHKAAESAVPRRHRVNLGAYVFSDTEQDTAGKEQAGETG
jgi:hypothetical protein